MKSNKHLIGFHPAKYLQSGFSLVEIMVGLVIGMLATAVIMQVLSVFETQKRSTSGTNDAQTNGSIALYTIGRDLQMAGYPLMPATNSALNCTTLTYGATGISGISPIAITEGVATPGVSASDSITIRYGSSPMGGVPTSITGLLVGSAAPVSNNFGCQVGDHALIVNGATCAITNVTAVTAAGVTPATITLQNTAAAAAGASLACLGTWNEITYRVNNGTLERIVGASAAVPIVAGVVNLQAQYGISATANSNQVTQWVDTSAAAWSAPTVANRNRIKAIRIAVVARNTQKEAGNITSACSSTTADAPTGLCAWTGSAASPAPTIDLSIGDPDWRHYRYRVFETIIPLRNMLWSKDSL